MAQNDTFHPSEARCIEMAVIECRTIGSNEWEIWLTFDDICQTEKSFLRRKCTELARRRPEDEWRFRHGTLTLEPSDKCEIFKSE